MKGPINNQGSVCNLVMTVDSLRWHTENLPLHITPVWHNSYTVNIPFVWKILCRIVAVTMFIQMLSNTSSDVRSAACEAFGCIGKHSDVISDQLLKDCIPSLLLMTKDKNTAVKASGEKAITDFLKLSEGRSVYNVSSCVYTSKCI